MVVFYFLEVMMKRLSLINSLMIVALITALYSCGDPFAEPVFNPTGSMSKSYTYETFPNFQMTIAEEIYFKAKDTSGLNFEPLVVGTNEYYLSSSNSKIHYANENKILVSIDIPDSSNLASKPAADENGNVMFVTLKGNVYSFDKKGNLLFSSRFDDSISKFELFTDITSLEDGFVLASSSGKIVKYNGGGKVLFEKQFGASVNKAISADKDRNLYFAISLNEFEKTDTLVSLDKSGKIRFKKAIQNVRILKNPIVANDLIFVAGVHQVSSKQEFMIFAFDKEGKEKWRKQVPVLPLYISASIDGTVYFAGFNTGVGESISGVFAYDEKGEQKWKLYIKAAISAPLLIGDEKIAIIGNTPIGAAAFFLRREDGKLMVDKSLTEQPPFYSHAAVLGDGSLMFSINHRLGVLRLTDTPINKILPW